MPRRVFITAAEVSGDQHASQLVRGLRQLEPDIIIEGHGGPHMRQAGALVHFETTKKAAMGWRAASRVAEMWKLLEWTKKHFDQNPPDLQICVDSPALNFHFAKAAHERSIPVLYYIAPQLWAWREGRMEKLRKWVDHVACILPFEEEYFRRHGVTATFVGHPLFDELPPNRRIDPARKYPNRAPIVGLLPGSRRSEARLNFPHLLDVARRLRHAIPDISFRVPTTPGTHDTVSELIARHSLGRFSLSPLLQVGQNQFDTMVPECDLCVTVSGTATLHVASYGVPMIVVYRGSAILWHLLGRWILKTRTYALVNLLNENRQHLVPEFIPWSGSNKPVALRAIDYLKHPEKLADQREKLNRLVQTLDKPGASVNAAQIALDLIAGPRIPVPAAKR